MGGGGSGSTYSQHGDYLAKHRVLRQAMTVAAYRYPQSFVLIFFPVDILFNCRLVEYVSHGQSRRKSFGTCTFS